jgi:3-demethoxyubiquinol 3-hydroxylase
MRNLSFVDRLIDDADRALRSLAAPASLQNRALPEPAQSHEDKNALFKPLDAADKRHVAGLMRINHAGEVAAQALYFGHARLAKSPQQRAHMLQAAAEEGDHLAWCAQRLQDLGARPSVFGPIWYAGAYAMGMLSAAVGDRFALGFVAETEAQVEAHLQDHEARLPVRKNCGGSRFALADSGLDAKNR